MPPEAKGTMLEDPTGPILPDPTGVNPLDPKGSKLPLISREANDVLDCIGLEPVGNPVPEPDTKPEVPAAGIPLDPITGLPNISKPDDGGDWPTNLGENVPLVCMAPLLPCHGFVDGCWAKMEERESNPVVLGTPICEPIMPVKEPEPGPVDSRYGHSWNVMVLVHWRLSDSQIPRNKIR